MEKSEHEDVDLTDGREIGDWKTRYTLTVWIRILLELIYLVLLLGFCISLLLDAASYRPSEATNENQIVSHIFGMQFAFEQAKWIALALAGVIGGIVFDLKWLYHSVAKGFWNQDRVIWRLVVPINSAMVSLFTGFLLASGIIPFIRHESFSEIYTLLGSGFVFGYFSDNVLAALQNLATRLFGTLRSED